MFGSQFFLRLLRDNRGATAIEYGLIVALVAIAALVAIQGTGDGNEGLWGGMTGKVENAMS